MKVLLFHDNWEVNLCNRLVSDLLQIVIEDTHSSIIMLKRNVELFHRIDDHSQTIYDVLENDNPPFFLFVLREAVLGVDQSHLFKNRRFTALSRT